MAGLGLVLEVPGVVAAGRIRVAPCHPATAPVLHAELARQQPCLQRQVEQETTVLGGQLVVQLRVVSTTFISTLPGIAAAAAGAVGVDRATAALPSVGTGRGWLLRLVSVLQALPPRTHQHWDGDLILVQAGQELL